jgi:hypothetical protein
MSSDPVVTYEQINLPDLGPVTLATVEQLGQARQQSADWSRKLADESAEAHADAEDKFAEAGALLVPAKASWDVPAELTQSIKQAEGSVTAIRDIDTQVAELDAVQHKGLGEFVFRFTRWGERQGLLKKREQQSTLLRASLVDVGQRAGGVVQAKVPAVAALLDQGTASADESALKAAQAAEVDKRVAELDAEIARRRESQEQMGFDAIYTAAYLHRFGAPAIQSPLELKRGEIAWFGSLATLARMQTRTTYVGGSSGVSFPIGHTGIRYRVGSFHGQPVQSQAMARVDTGTFVVTNQRIAFVGHMKAVAILLNKLLHVDAYSDGIAVLHEGKENADYFLMASPQQAVFYINWAIASVNQPVASN